MSTHMSTRTRQVSYSEFVDAFVLNAIKGASMPVLSAANGIDQLREWQANLNIRIGECFQRHYDELRRCEPPALQEYNEVLPPIDLVRWRHVPSCGVMRPLIGGKERAQNVIRVINGSLTNRPLLNEIHELFRRLDRNDDGRLDAEDFTANALENRVLCVHMHADVSLMLLCFQVRWQEVFRELLRDFDEGNKGYISFEDFYRGLIRKTLQSTSPGLALPLEDQLYLFVSQFNINLRQAMDGPKRSAERLGWPAKPPRTLDDV